jgi:phospholipid-binding lipoprotein MlaA
MIRNAVPCTKQRRVRAPIPWPRGSLVMVALYFALAGCASLPAGEQTEPADPLEPLNRAVFDANIALDDAVIRPLAEAYRTVVPPFVRDRIRAVLDNLAEPRIFANDLLQRRPNAAGITFARFAINSVAGLGGMFDVATGQGYARQSGDFGQTLYSFGVSEGPYVVLLFFGPSNFRDALGLGVDLFTTPPALVLTGHTGTVINFAVGTVNGMDLRSRNIETLDEIKASAIDYYAHLKSITWQHREAQLREASGGQEEPQELTDPGAPAPAAPQQPEVKGTEQ